MLAADLAQAIDPCLVFQAAGMEPDPWQAGVLRSAAPRLLLNCHRQSGKSTVAAGAAIHTAVYEPGSLVLILSPSQRQSGELFRKARDLYRHLGKPVPPVTESALRLELATGSRIVSLPGKESTVRGFSAASLLVVDEAARVPDELLKAVRPMLAVSGGRLIALSTPFGKSGWFYDEWTGNSDTWHRVKVTADQNPRISEEFLEEERAALGEAFYRQEYRCSFEDFEGALFSSEEIEQLLEPWTPPPPV